MKISNIKPEQAEKIFYYGSPFVTYIMALWGGLWWLSDQAVWGGILFLLGLCAYGYEVGYKQYYKSSTYFFYFTFITPCILGIILFSIGFII